jgi:L-seryl-tRNA(Ser) seleniumtransferase
VEDLGSGTLVPPEPLGLPREAFAPERLRLGADLVCFSGDKLLGGPQAGVALGRRQIVSAMARNPLARALRLDKLSLAALDWTLRALLDGRGLEEVPVLRQLAAAPDGLRERAEKLASRLAVATRGAVALAVEPDRSAVGGGSLPGLELPTWVIAVRGEPGPEALAARLRASDVPVIGRVRDDALLLDVRTLLDGDEDALERALAAAVRVEAR